jgi:hypothetical protein
MVISGAMVGVWLPREYQSPVFDAPTATRGMSQHNGLHQHGSAFVYSYPDQENSTGILMLFSILADILMGPHAPWSAREARFLA